MRENLNRIVYTCSFLKIAITPEEKVENGKANKENTTGRLKLVISDTQIETLRSRENIDKKCGSWVVGSLQMRLYAPNHMFV